MKRDEAKRILDSLEEMTKIIKNCKGEIRHLKERLWEEERENNRLRSEIEPYRINMRKMAKLLKKNNSAIR